MSDKKYPGQTITGMFAGKGFVYATAPIDQRVFDNIMSMLQTAQVGGAIRVKRAKEGSKIMGFLELLTPEEVAQEKKAYENWKSNNDRSL